MHRAAFRFHDLSDLTSDHVLAFFMVNHNTSLFQASLEAVQRSIIQLYRTIRQESVSRGEPVGLNSPHAEIDKLLAQQSDDPSYGPRELEFAVLKAAEMHGFREIQRGYKPRQLL